MSKRATAGASARQIAKQMREAYAAWCEKRGMAMPTYRSTNRNIARASQKK